MEKCSDLFIIVVPDILSCHICFLSLKKILKPSKGINLHKVLTNTLKIDGLLRERLSATFVFVISFPGVEENVISNKK
jgi:hypothetical protein